MAGSFSGAGVGLPVRVTGWERSQPGLWRPGAPAPTVLFLFSRYTPAPIPSFPLSPWPPRAVPVILCPLLAGVKAWPRPRTPRGLWGISLLPGSPRGLPEVALAPERDEAGAAGPADMRRGCHGNRAGRASWQEWSLAEQQAWPPTRARSGWGARDQHDKAVASLRRAWGPPHPGLSQARTDIKGGPLPIWSHTGWGLLLEFSDAF